jgi:hypothetical protein
VTDAELTAWLACANLWAVAALAVGVVSLAVACQLRDEE